MCLHLVQLNATYSSAQVIYINCNSSNEIKFKIDEKMDMSKSDYNNLAKEVLASLSSSVMFILQSDRNNNVSYTGGKLSDITLQVSEGFDLEKNENLFSKFIEWIKIFMENSFGIRLDKASVRITKLDKPNSKMEDATVQPCEQKLVPHAMGI
ncbi:hypothetical protein [Candidatus Mesenet endosymbiont of Phosphuga atrata]|uniref:hypothetical protein n=1 Tax=Candidatus Mesenet endosymbiont of Phosphuga atrata TaxID=3066221 RepID=UPI0030D1AEBD